MSAVFSTQALRLHHSHVSPLQWMVYGLVSLGGHFLLWSLLRWTLQAPWVGQPQGEPLAIELIELDGTAEDLLAQLPGPTTPLTAAELNAAIAERSMAPPMEPLIESPIEPLAEEMPPSGRDIPVEANGDRSPADPVSPPSTPIASAPRAEGRPTNPLGSGLRRILDSQSSPAEADPSAPDPSSNATPVDPSSRSPDSSSESGENGDNGGNTRPDPAIADPAVGDANRLPPNMNPQPVTPEKIATGETDLPDPPAGSSPNPQTPSDGGSTANEASANTPAAEPGDRPSDLDATGVSATPSPSRFGARLSIDWALTELENQRDPAQVLPSPRVTDLSDVGNPSAQAVCTSLVNQASLSEFGQPINLALEVSPSGQVLQAVPLNAEATSPSYIAALQCLAEAWTFEPGLRDGQPATAVVVVVLSLELLP